MQSRKHKRSVIQIYSIKTDCTEYVHYSLSEETKLLIPGVTVSLQTRNIRIWPTSAKHTGLQPVPDRYDLPNSVKEAHYH
jgi:hypothetical protein